MINFPKPKTTHTLHGNLKLKSTFQTAVMIAIAKSHNSSASYERNTLLPQPNAPMSSLVQAAAVSGNGQEDAVLLRNRNKRKDLKP